MLPLTVKNCAVCVRGTEDENTLYNRVEVDTKFNFEKVRYAVRVVRRPQEHTAAPEMIFT